MLELQPESHAHAHVHRGSDGDGGGKGGSRHLLQLQLPSQGQLSGSHPNLEFLSPSLQDGPCMTDVFSKQWDEVPMVHSSALEAEGISIGKLHDEEEGIIHYIDAPKRLEMDKANLNMVSLDDSPGSLSLSGKLKEVGGLVAGTFRGARTRVNRLILTAKIQRDTAATFFGSEDDGELNGPYKWGGYADPSASGEAMQGIIFDMGYYEWRYLGSGGLPEGIQSHNGSMPTEQGSCIHLLQVVSSALAPRVLLFKWPLAITSQWEKLAPGFFDAPGASSLSFPSMFEAGSTRDLKRARPKVVIVFASLEGYGEICATDLELGQEVLSGYNACVRETLAIIGGYECKEINGSFMAAFANSCTAVEWAITLHLALAATSIAQDALDRTKLPHNVAIAAAKLLSKGVYARIGIYEGTIDRVTPNHKTGRADYFGQPVNRAARLMSAASGGQTLCEQSFMVQVLQDWHHQQQGQAVAQQNMAEQAQAGAARAGAAAGTAAPAGAESKQQRRLSHRFHPQPPQQQPQLQQQDQEELQPSFMRMSNVSQHMGLVAPSRSVSVSLQGRPNLQSLSMQPAPWRPSNPSSKPLAMQRKPWDPEQPQQQLQQLPSKTSSSRRGSQQPPLPSSLSAADRPPALQTHSSQQPSAAAAAAAAAAARPSFERLSRTAGTRPQDSDGDANVRRTSNCMMHFNALFEAGPTSPTVPHDCSVHFFDPDSAHDQAGMHEQPRASVFALQAHLESSPLPEGAPEELVASAGSGSRRQPPRDSLPASPFAQQQQPQQRSGRQSPWNSLPTSPFAQQQQQQQQHRSQRKGGGGADAACEGKRRSATTNHMVAETSGTDSSSGSAHHSAPQHRDLPRPESPELVYLSGDGSNGEKRCSARWSGRQPKKGGSVSWAVSSQQQTHGDRNTTGSLHSGEGLGLVSEHGDLGRSFTRHRSLDRGRVQLPPRGKSQSGVQAPMIRGQASMSMTALVSGEDTSFHRPARRARAPSGSRAEPAPGGLPPPPPPLPPPREAGREGRRELPKRRESSRKLGDGGRLDADGSVHKLNAEVFELKGGDGQREDITLFKYRNGLGTLSQGATLQDQHSDAQLPPNKPTSDELVKVMVEVSATALGVYRLKGVTELVHVVRVMPASQEQRAIRQNSNKLEGKATCVTFNPTKLGAATIPLPDVRQLFCCAASLEETSDLLSPALAAAAPQDAFQPFSLHDLVTQRSSPAPAGGALGAAGGGGGGCSDSGTSACIRSSEGFWRLAGERRHSLLVPPGWGGSGLELGGGSPGRVMRRPQIGRWSSVPSFRPFLHGRAPAGGTFAASPLGQAASPASTSRRAVQIQEVLEAVQMGPTASGGSVVAQAAACNSKDSGGRLPYASSSLGQILISPDHPSLLEHLASLSTHSMQGPAPAEHSGGTGALLPQLWQQPPVSSGLIEMDMREAGHTGPLHPICEDRTSTGTFAVPGQ